MKERSRLFGLFTNISVEIVALWSCYPERSATETVHDSDGNYRVFPVVTATGVDDSRDLTTQWRSSAGLTENRVRQ